MRASRQASTRRLKIRWEKSCIFNEAEFGAVGKYPFVGFRRIYEIKVLLLHSSYYESYVYVNLGDACFQEAEIWILWMCSIPSVSRFQTKMSLDGLPVSLKWNGRLDNFFYYEADIYYYCEQYHYIKKYICESINNYYEVWLLLVVAADWFCIAMAVA